MLFISSSDQFSYFIIAILSLLAWCLLIRWAVKATTIANNSSEMLRQQQAIVWLLIKLCEKNGVSKEDIENIKNAFYIK